MDDRLAAAAAREFAGLLEIPLANARVFAELTEIPSRTRALFCADLLKQLRGLRRVGAKWRRPEPYLWLKPIAEQAADLRDSLLSGLGVDKRLGPGERLNKIEERRRLIAVVVTRGAQTREDCDDMFAFHDALDALAQPWKTLPGARHLQTAKRPRGAPREPSPWHPGALARDTFATALQKLVVQHGGTPLTAAKDGTGTMFKVLDALGVAYTCRGVVRAIRPSHSDKN